MRWQPGSAASASACWRSLQLGDLREPRRNGERKRKILKEMGREKRRKGEGKLVKAMGGERQGWKGVEKENLMLHSFVSLRAMPSVCKIWGNVGYQTERKKWNETEMNCHLHGQGPKNRVFLNIVTQLNRTYIIARISPFEQENY